jgi:hypothetical protein
LCGSAVQVTVVLVAVVVGERGRVVVREMRLVVTAADYDEAVAFAA